MKERTLIIKNRDGTYHSQTVRFGAHGRFCRKYFLLPVPFMMGITIGLIIFVAILLIDKC